MNKVTWLHVLTAAWLLLLRSQVLSWPRMLEDTSSLALVKVTAVMEQLSALSYTCINQSDVRKCNQ